MAFPSKAARVDGVEKVTGEAKYTGDLDLPGLLEARVLRSPLPHARIESINIERAAALSGVAAILTRDDVNDINPFYGNCLRDRPLIALDRVRFVGEPVAVVAAEDPLIAEQAHENTADTGEFHDIANVGGVMKSNVCHYENFERGDIARGFAESEEVIEEVFEFPMIYQYAMEPHTSVARVTRPSSCSGAM